MKPNYKTSRKYKCPYCDKLMTRSELVDHVSRKHVDMIPEGYTAARAVYDSINKKDYGTCMICGKKVYAWNDKIDRYRNLCYDPKCRAKVRENALQRHIRVYNKPTLLNDAEQQEKMLANRRISGTYVFTDGTKMTYTGKYERNALEFMDKVLEIPAKDIQAPGPVLEYEYNGEVHKWITDIYYIPANLLIEVKDGGSNPNNRSMVSYREKQIAKETMITSIGTFNYVRLTNNNFAQLLEALADIKAGSLADENPNMKIHINEEVGGMPPHRPPEAYIIPYGMNNAFSGGVGLAYKDSNMDDNMLAIVNDDGYIEPIAENLFKSLYKQLGPKLVYTESDLEEKIKTLYEIMRSGDKKYGLLIFAEVLMGRSLRKFEQILIESSCFKYLDDEEQNKTAHFIENAASMGLKFAQDADVVETHKYVMICRSIDGYYAKTVGAFNMASDYYNDIETLRNSGVIDLMNNIYISNMKEGGKES